MQRKPSSIAFDNSYAKLPGAFYARLNPTAVARPALIKVNAELCAALGIDAAFLASPDGIGALAGNRVLDGSEPLAMAYSGHQFGNWAGQLGDGRALLLGEVLDAQGTRFDIQLKGSGRTPFSRGGDGRAALGPVLREYVLSEAMHALNIPTTRALAAVTSGETVVRDTALPGAVLTRVARGHIRVGTFEYFAARQDSASLRVLADYVIARFYPTARDSDAPYLSLFQQIVAAQAALVARWMGVGFIHGVMNTDNMSIAGETIDFGPCAFMDTYHPHTVFSSIDRMGRYAYAKQPQMAQWNLTRLGSTLVGLLDTDGERAVARAQEVLEGFGVQFAADWGKTFRAKLGLVRQEDGDAVLIGDLLAIMADHQADFTQTFRALADCVAATDEAPPTGLPAALAASAGFQTWQAAWRARLAREDRSEADIRAHMRAVNPAYIPRNHRVEQMIAAAVNGDFAPFERLTAVLARPFDDQPDCAAYQAAPEPEEIVRETFCGT